MNPFLLSLAVSTLPWTFALNIPSQQILSDELKLSQNVPVIQPLGRETCPQARKVAAPADGMHSSLHFLDDESFRAHQAQRLSKAVQIPTTVGDFMTDPYDEAFEPVVKFQQLLKDLFPLVYVSSRLQVRTTLTPSQQPQTRRHRPHQPPRSGIHLPRHRPHPQTTSIHGTPRRRPHRRPIRLDPSTVLRALRRRMDLGARVERL